MVRKVPVLLEGSEGFPPSSAALTSPEGLIAIGGDLSINRLRQAYRLGYFPWYSEKERILWWTQNPRMVFLLENLYISPSIQKSLRRFANTPGARVLVNHDFERIIKECAAPRSPHTGTWILPEMQAAYLAWHEQGEVHSVEAWINDTLIGGTYGVSIGGVFHGESMFSRQANGSKIALFYLMRYLQQQGALLLDAQVYNPHLDQLGAREIPLSQFEQLLAQAHQLPTPFWGRNTEITPQGQILQG